jgi:class 3 adenylate cyclase/tetratricopeptide (TPR) repeat protein
VPRACSNCAAEVASDARFCAQCGQPVAPACPSCGAEVAADARFCASCGTPLDDTKKDAIGSGEARKIVSVLFADLAGFTAHTERSDPEDVRARLTTFHRQIRRDVERHGGRVEKLIGDGVFAVFGAPIAHEDDPERAVRSALRAQESIEQLNAADPDLGLKVRMAVTTGEAIVQLDTSTPDREGVIGDVVNTASRLENVAESGTLVVDYRTHAATRGAIEYAPLPPVELKGKAEPVQIWRAVAARSRYGVAVGEHEPTRFVGRDRELGLLVDALDRTIERSAAQLVTISGEPGVGKSRLIREFMNAVDQRPDLMWWRQGRCLPYGDQTTFSALGELVKAQAGILESESAASAREKLTLAVDALIDRDSDRHWITSTLEPLVGIGGHTTAGSEELVAGWRRFFGAMAQQRPLVIVIEDMHWADQAMIEFLDELVGWAFDLPILLVCTARPELYADHPDWGGGRRNGINVALVPLGDDDVALLLTTMLPTPLVDAELQRSLLERCGGNPLYAIEYARLVAEGGELAPPDSVQALIASRLDLLSPTARRIAQAAAVIGRVFWANGIAFAMSIPMSEVSEGIRELVDRDLVWPVRSPSMTGQDEYSFRHILVRDVAYGQIPRVDRAALHEETARWIEALVADSEDVVGILAHHYDRAFELRTSLGERRTDLMAQAFRFSLAAAERAIRLDTRSGIELFARAAELADDEVRRASILSGMAVFEGDMGAIDAAFAHLDEAAEIFRTTDMRGKRAEALVRKARYAWLQGDKSAEAQLAADAMREIEGLEPGPEVAYVLRDQANRLFLSGGWEEAADIGERALAMTRATGSPSDIGMALRTLGSALVQSPDQARGMEMLHEAHRIGRDLGDITYVYASNNLHAYVNLLDGAIAGLEIIEPAIEFATQRGVDAARDFTRSSRVESLIPLGRWDEAKSELEEIIRLDAERGTSQIATMCGNQLMAVHFYRGEYQDAYQLLRPTMQQAREIRDPQVLVPSLGVAIPIAVAAGDVELGRSLIDELVEVSRGPGDSYVDGCMLSGLTEIADVDASSLSRIAAATSQQTTLARHSHSAVLGVIEHRAGRAGEAAAHLASAVDGLERIDYLLHAAICRVFEAHARLDLGDHDRALELLEMAEAFFTPIGGRHFTGRIQTIRSHLAA